MVGSAASDVSAFPQATAKPKAAISKNKLIFFIGFILKVNNGEITI